MIDIWTVIPLIIGAFFVGNALGLRHNTKDWLGVFEKAASNNERLLMMINNIPILQIDPEFAKKCESQVSRTAPPKV